jgi:hypothetical protein
MLASMFLYRMERQMKIEGGCLCGKVRYSAEAEPAFVGVCHCKNCQKGTGTAFAIVVAVPTPALNVQGTLQTFTGRGDSGKSTHRLMAGTLDDPSWVKPGMEIFCDSAQPWVELGGDRQRFAKMPG